MKRTSAGGYFFPQKILLKFGVMKDRLEVHFQHKPLLELLEFGYNVILHLLFIAVKKSYLKPTFLFCEDLPHIHLMMCIIYV